MSKAAICVAALLTLATASSAQAGWVKTVTGWIWSEAIKVPSTGCYTGEPCAKGVPTLTPKPYRGPDHFKIHKERAYTTGRRA